MFFCMYVSATHVCNAQEEKRALDPPELKLLVVVTRHVDTGY